MAAVAHPLTKHEFREQYAERRPTEAVDVGIEILSPEDWTTQAIDKCQHYARIETRAVFWVNPESRVGWLRDLLNAVFAQTNRQTT